MLDQLRLQPHLPQGLGMVLQLINGHIYRKLRVIDPALPLDGCGYSAADGIASRRYIVNLVDLRLRNVQLKLESPVPRPKVTLSRHISGIRLYRHFGMQSFVGSLEIYGRSLNLLAPRRPSHQTNRSVALRIVSRSVQGNVRGKYASQWVSDICGLLNFSKLRVVRIHLHLNGIRHAERPLVQAQRPRKIDSTIARGDRIAVISSYRRRVGIDVRLDVLPMRALHA